MSADTENLRDRTLQAMLELAATGRWAVASMTDIATEAGLTPADLRTLFCSKAAILAAFVEIIDQKVLSQDFHFEDEDTPRDRLFEVLMSRFDSLGEHREVVSALCRDLPGNPLAAISLGPTALISTGWMLEAAGISTSGPFGLLRTKGLLAVWLATLRVWLTDDSPDLSRTMAALDRYLRQAERAAIELQRFEGPRRTTLETDVVPETEETGEEKNGNH